MFQKFYTNFFASNSSFTPLSLRITSIKIRIHRPILSWLVKYHGNQSSGDPVSGYLSPPFIVVEETMRPNIRGKIKGQAGQEGFGSSFLNGIWASCVIRTCEWMISLLSLLMISLLSHKNIMMLWKPCTCFENSPERHQRLVSWKKKKKSIISSCEGYNPCPFWTTMHQIFLAEIEWD